MVSQCCTRNPFDPGEFHLEKCLDHFYLNSYLSIGDIFKLDEISIYEGEWNENVYAVSGEVVDSVSCVLNSFAYDTNKNVFQYLYDLLLNYLEEKGISNEFVEKLSDYATAYEHSAYISLLEGLSKFASGK